MCESLLALGIPFDCLFWCFDLFKPTDDCCGYVCTVCVCERFLNHPAPSQANIYIADDKSATNYRLTVCVCVCVSGRASG